MQHQIARSIGDVARVLEFLVRGGIQADNLASRAVTLDAGTGWVGKLDAVYLAATTNAVVDTETGFAHTLGRVPAGYIVVKRAGGGVVYNGTTAWTATMIYLKCTTVANVVTLIVF